MVLAVENDHVEGTLIRDGRIFAATSAGADPAQLVPSCASQLMRSGRLDSTDQVRLVAHGPNGSAAGLESVGLRIAGAAADTNALDAICAALLSLVRSGFRLNLIPAQLRHQRNYLRFVPTYALVALLALLGIFAWVREPYQQSLYAERLDAEGKRLAVEVRSVADQEARLNRVSERIKTLDALVRGRDANLEALRELSRILPPGTWLTSYICQDNVVTITGFSESAASIQKLIEDSPVFRDAQFTSAITRDVSGKDRFTVRASIEVRQ
jgi:Tfp pilus assembly protein PilN